MGLMVELGVRDRTDSAVARAAKRAVAVPGVSRVLAHVLPAVDRAALRLTGGRTTPTEVFAGLPTILLTTTGARSGLPRTVPLVAIPLVGGPFVEGAFAGDIAVIGSNWGGASHPAWVHNIAANPRVSVARGSLKVDAVAVALAREQAEAVWARAASMYAGYASYRERAGGRDIRVFALTTVGRAGGDDPVGEDGLP